MAAPKDNQFWTLRERNGRKKIFETPEELWEQAQEYFNWCDENPLVEIDYKGKENEMVDYPRMRAYTWSGLELYLDISSLRHYKNNETHKDFLQIITRIEKIIYTQKFEGSAAGMLNPNIIARDLGLTDKKEVDAKVTETKQIFKIGDNEFEL